MRFASALRLGPSVPFQRLAALLFVVATIAVLSGCGINTIPTLEERAKASWSEVQNQYQRRAELIPNLVETVKGYANQEREVLTQVIEARAKATQVQVRVDQLTDPEALRKFQEAQAQLSTARLHSGGAGLQHRDKDFPWAALGDGLWRQADGDFLDHGREPAAAAGEILKARCIPP